jgi:exodeoxyribonuclease VII large subunit
MLNERNSMPASPVVWAVGALCRAIADALEGRFNPVTVGGEVSGFTRAASGHCYFSLKDESGQLRCAMFKRAASLLDFVPRDGELVEVRARLGVYEPRGELQLVVEGMRRAGQGALFEQFLRVKARLESEGLFDASRKRPLPAMPRGIGLVTSLGAAALHDVATALQRRVPHIPVVLAPAAVQGESAPRELAQALETLFALCGPGANTLPCIDVILLVRGGGSMEDLASFNDEALARTIAASPVPVVCGVGHETDFTIADFVADLRAPTPTAAAELVSQTQEDLWLALAALQEALGRALTRRLDTQEQRLDAALARLGRPSAMAAKFQLTLQSSPHRLLYVTQSVVQQKLHSCQWLRELLTERVQGKLTQVRGHVEEHAVRLRLLDPSLVLQRGYAWVTDVEGRTVSNVQDLALGQALQLQLAKGKVGVAVAELE